ncbi:MAG: hypothetical protein K1Y36_22295 [Blastocatellia bacterium]|nr:hypothetical protein [Blastocatellia bacterium]
MASLSIQAGVGVLRGLELRAGDLFCPGDSRHQAKTKARENGQLTWAFSDGIIRSHGTLKTYWPIWVRFAKWARTKYSIHKWGQLVAASEKLASEYLHQRLSYSPSTLTTERSALRMLFGQRELAATVSVPSRTGVTLKKSRVPAKRDAQFNPANWQTMLNFAQAVGTRRNELRHLRVMDVQCNEAGIPISVLLGAHSSAKGGKVRTVLLLPYQRRAVSLALAEATARGATAEALLFEPKIDRETKQPLPLARVPSRLDVHAQRHEFARDLYQRISGEPLPPPHSEGRLKPGTIDRTAAGEVAVRLGHGRHRIDTVVKNYLRR